MTLFPKKLLYLIWFWLMVMIDEYLIHIWWDNVADNARIDTYLANFCMYAQGGYLLARRRKWRY